MPWYTVRKRIKGKLYLYRQRSWREGGKVRTQSKYIGPAGDSSPDAVNPTSTEYVNTTKIEQATPVHREVPAALSNKATIEATAKGGEAEDFEIGKRTINWDRPQYRPSVNTTTGGQVKDVEIAGDLSDRKISQQALLREFDALCQNITKLGLHSAYMPRVRIEEGSKAGWRKHWLNERTYTVTLPKEGGRTAFKQAYREALASAFLEEVRRQDSARYNRIINAAGSGFGRGRKAREVITTIMRKGMKEAKRDYRTEKKTHKPGFHDIWGHVSGHKLCLSLERQGFKW